MATFNAQGHSVVVEVSPDIHICGFCKQQYNNFEVFLAHKQNGCSIHTSDISTSAVTSSLTDSNTEFFFEETYQTSVMKGVKKLMTKPQKTPSKTLKPALTSKRHSCCFSGCTFNTQYGQKDMERHLKTHTGEKPFECELCHKRFSRRDKLNMHSRLHTGEKPHKCKHCAYAAADSSSLKKHLRIHYDERPFKCQICPYASRNSSQLTVHLRSHTGDAPFQCQQCEAKFKINSDLKRHARIHSGEKPYKCDLCEYRCAMKGNLKSHVHIKHGTANTFRCAHCDFRCANKTALRQHSREHQPVQPMQCPTCTYSCASKGALKVHERIHSEERPFKCDLCSFASKQRSNLLLHKKKSHSEKAEKGGAAGAGDSPRPPGSRYRAKLEAARAFRCPLCQASFVREDSLRSHRKQHRHAQLQAAGGHGDRPLAPYGSARLKIMVSHPVGPDGQSVVLLPSAAAHGQEVVLMGPQAMLLGQMGPEEHQTLLHTSGPSSLDRCGAAASQTFITACSDLEGLSTLIREGGTEVTVVTDDGDAGSATPSLGAVAKQQQQQQAGAVGQGGGGFVVPNISLAGPGMVIHGLPLMASAHTQPHTMEHLYSDTHGMDTVPQ